PDIILKHTRFLKLTLQNFSLMRFFLIHSFRSYWGVFGWMTIVMPPVFYWIASVLTLGMIRGAFLTFKKALFSDSEKKKTFILMLCSIPVLLAFSIILSANIDLQAQGRYFFPTLV